MHKPQLSKSAFSATSTSTTTSVNASWFSQPELAIEQHQQGFFVGLSTTVHTPESTQIPATYYQQDELRLLSGISVSDISSSQIDPFEILATHQSVTFEDQNQFLHQEQLDEFPLPFDELLQPVDDFDLMASEDPDDVNLSILPNKNDERISNRTTISIPEQEILPSINNHFRRALTGTVPEAFLTALTGELQLLTGHYITGQVCDPTDKWIIRTNNKDWPFKCGYEGCFKRYSKKSTLKAHFATHTGASRFRCYLGKCNGVSGFSDKYTLGRHIRTKHTLEKPYRCNICDERFGRKDRLKSHSKNVHSIEDEKKPPRKRK